MTNKTLTIKQLANEMGMDYIVAASLVKVMTSKGVAKAVGKLETPKGTKGKPSVTYEIPESFTLSLFSANPLAGAVAPVVPAETTPVETPAETPAPSETPSTETASA
jgi:predicted deacylase